MSDTSELDQIIDQLQRLTIEKDLLLTQERQLIRRARQIREASKPRKSDKKPKTTFRQGDLVYITNQIRHLPKGQVTSVYDRISIVRKVTDTRIYLSTANKQETWRIPTNVRHCNQEENEKHRVLFQDILQGE